MMNNDFGEKKIWIIFNFLSFLELKMKKKIDMNILIDFLYKLYWLYSNILNVWRILIIVNVSYWICYFIIGLGNIC